MDYWPASRSRPSEIADLCAHARDRQIRRVLILRDLDDPAANAVVSCDARR